MMECDKHLYTTGGDPTVLHRRLLGAGGYGEVHEAQDSIIYANRQMYDIPLCKVPTTFRPAFIRQSFARKLIRIPRVEAKVIDNEIRVLTELSREGIHPHIVAVLRIGELPNSQDLFIDMELCDLNLAEYIYGSKPRDLVPTFFIKDQSPPMKASQVWTVMLQLAKGVEYLHRKAIIHRDLKPANVLYSRKDGIWKLADFGLSSQLSSKSIGVTTSVRGTSGYFAPEFLVHPGSMTSYNNKVDIWALGCILYEFVVGERAFDSDYFIIQYKFCRALPEITLDEYFSDEDKEMVQSAVTRMLDIEPSARPTAADLVEQFSSNSQRTMRELLHEVQIYQEFRALHIHSSEPEIVASVAIVAEESSINVEETTQEGQRTTQTDREIQMFQQQSDVLLDAMTIQPTRALLLAAIEKEPLNFWLWHAHSTLCARERDFRGAITACRNAIQKSPGNPAPIMELTNLYAGEAHYSMAVRYGLTLWKLDPAKVQSALTVSRNPLVISVVDNLTFKQASLELITPRLTENIAYINRWLSKNPPFKVSFRDDISQLHYAGWCGDVDAIQALRRGGAPLGISDKDRHTVLHWAVMNMHIEAVRMLLSFPPKPSHFAVATSLHYAAANADVDMIRVIANLGGCLIGQLKIEKDGMQAIHTTAFWHATLTAIKTLEDVGVDIHAKDKNGSTIMHLTAAQGNRLDTMQYLRGKGLNISAQNKAGETPMHMAAAEGHVKMMQWLKDRGADVEAVDLYGNTPMHTAARRGHASVIEYLRQAGVDINVRNKITGSTPLHVAVETVIIGIKAETSVRVLLRLGAHISAQDNDGQTPLHLATAKRHWALACELRDAGADLRLRNNDGKTPSDLAQLNGLPFLAKDLAP